MTDTLPSHQKTPSQTIYTLCAWSRDATLIAITAGTPKEGSDATVLDQQFSPRSTLGPGGHLAISGDFLKMPHLVYTTGFGWVETSIDHPMMHRRVPIAKKSGTPNVSPGQKEAP
jgi:hypothetical protein